MDAFDIFKKLSQGAKFKRKLPINNLDTVQEKKIKQEIKDDKEVFKIKEEPTYETQSNIKNDENTDSVADRELTLLGSMVATESGRKKKKEKKKILDESKKLMLEQEKIKQYRNENRIHVYGRHIPPPIKSFTDLKIKEDLIENLAKCGYNEPTPIQKQAIPIMLQRRQILACAPTGSGKTAAFMLPIIHSLEGPQRKGFRALILCPTRELAKQSQRECARLAEGRGFRIHVISKIKEGLTNYGPKSNQKFDILVTTPNRICYLLNQDPPALSLSNVEWLVVDEADKLFEEGMRGFRDQLDQIMKSCTSEKLKIAMFSATQTVDVSRWCKKNMKGLINVTVGLRNAATDLVDQELLFVGNESGKLLAFRNLVKKGLAPPVLVFVQSKDRAQQLFSELIYDGINVDAIHADRTQTQRDNTVRSFREGKIWVLICTELMARGVDFKGVNLVINYDFPPSAIAYVHRIGRAGRAGRRGKAITFFTVDDTPNLRSIAHILKQSGCDVPDYMLAMKKTSKKERNKVIDREDISTKLRYISSKKLKKRRMLRRKRMAEENIEDPSKKKVKIAKGDHATEKIKPKKKFSVKKKTHGDQNTGTKKKIKLNQMSSVKKKGSQLKLMV